MVWWRHEAAIGEPEYPPTERDLVGCVEVENGARTMIFRRLDEGYQVKSVSDQKDRKEARLPRPTSEMDGNLSELCCIREACMEGRGESGISR